MKIVYIIKDITVIGGREKILIDKINNFIELGHDIYLVNYQLKNLKNLEKINENVKIYNLNFEYKTEKNSLEKILNTLIVNFFRKKKLKKLLKNQILEIRPDLTISLLEFGFEQILNIKNLNSKNILEIHGCYDYFKNFREFNYLRKIKGYFDFNQLRKNMKNFDKVVILSNIDKKKWNLKNIEIIPNFYVKKDNIKIKKNFEEKKFLSAGRLSYEKGYDILIEVWKKVMEINKNIKIDIYGEGLEREKILDMIKKNNLEENIFIHSFTNKLNEKYKEYYGYILPSRFEAFPMVILESMSNGVPVIAFEIDCGIKDMITSKEEGILIDKYNLSKMAEKIIELYNNEKLREELAINSLKKSEEFIDENIISKWIDLFEKV